MYSAFKEDPDIYVVERQDKLYCSCRESVYDGVPWRHELAICLTFFKKNLGILNVSKRWRQDYFDFGDPSLSEEDELEEDEEGKVEEKKEEDEEEEEEK